MTSRNGKARAPASYLHRPTIDHSGRWSAILGRGGRGSDGPRFTRPRITFIPRTGDALMSDLVIRAATFDDLETIVDFNVRLAEETEDIAFPKILVGFNP